MKRTSNLSGRAALVISIVALVMACAGGAYAIKLGKNSVKSSAIKNKAITTKKIAAEAVTTGKLAAKAVTTEKLAASAAIPAYIRFNSSGAYQPGQSKNVVGINQPVPNVACVDLTFLPKTAVASRGVGGGAPPINAAQVAVGSDAVTLGCNNPPFTDAAVQVAAAASVQDVTAWFLD